MRHDLRKTLLTMLGMAWGIATVVLLLAYGDGFGRRDPGDLANSVRPRSEFFRAALRNKRAAARRGCRFALRKMILT